MTRTFDIKQTTFSMISQQYALVHSLQCLSLQLALRAGNEKEEGETADTVGCCSLRREHLTLHEKYDDKEYVVEFDFLGKDSIRYYNRIPVEKRVFKNLQLFMENKAGEDDVFDRLNVCYSNLVFLVPHQNLYIVSMMVVAINFSHFGLLVFNYLWQVGYHSL